MDVVSKKAFVSNRRGQERYRTMEKYQSLRIKIDHFKALRFSRSRRLFREENGPPVKGENPPSQRCVFK